MSKLFVILALALVACGSPKKSPDAKGDPLGKAKEGQGDGTHLPEATFRQKCRRDSTEYPNAKIVKQNGSMYCIVPKGASVPNNARQFSVIDVDPGYIYNKWIYAHGQGGSEIQVNGVRISGSEYDGVGPADVAGGLVQIYVGRSSDSQIEVITYDCLDDNLNRVLCNRGQIYPSLNDEAI